ncbi:MAG: hypothetical protein HYZ21_12910 [Chloroflexi bacterium]|nr:hypothetical protein [Chloroflexota bacterium]
MSYIRGYDTHLFIIECVMDKLPHDNQHAIIQTQISAGHQHKQLGRGI